MSTDNITPQTGVAGEDTTDLVTDEDATVSEDRGDSDFYLHIITSHIHCGGIVSLVDGECDEDDLCELQWGKFPLGSLGDLTFDRLAEVLHLGVVASGNHGCEVGPDYDFTTLQYVYHDEDKEAESLLDLSDEELRAILAGGSGVVVAEWEWID